MYKRILRTPIHSYSNHNHAHTCTCTLTKPIIHVHVLYRQSPSLLPSLPPSLPPPPLPAPSFLPGADVLIDHEPVDDVVASEGVGEVPQSVAVALRVQTGDGVSHLHPYLTHYVLHLVLGGGGGGGDDNTKFNTKHANMSHDSYAHNSSVEGATKLKFAPFWLSFCALSVDMLFGRN